MIKDENKFIFVHLLFIMAGAFILASAINVFYNPNSVAIGGVSGIAIIVKECTKNIINGGVPLWVTNLVFNIPLLIAAVKFMGKGFLFRTIFGTVFLSIALALTEFLPQFKGDLLLVSIYGGVIEGCGIGLTLKGFGSTGGSDLVAVIINNIKKNIPVSKIILVIDGIIVLTGSFVFSIESAMYAVISIYVSTKLISAILEGMNFSKAAFIISDESDKIANALLENIERGVTALKGKGMYTKKELEVLLCVFSQKEVEEVKQVVKNIDENAFIILTDIKEVLGRGFKNIQ